LHAQATTADSVLLPQYCGSADCADASRVPDDIGSHLTTCPADDCGVRPFPGLEVRTYADALWLLDQHHLLLNHQARSATSGRLKQVSNGIPSFMFAAWPDRIAYISDSWTNHANATVTRSSRDDECRGELSAFELFNAGPVSPPTLSCMIIGSNVRDFLILK
jgi:hypothetical protein